MRKFRALKNFRKKSDAELLKSGNAAADGLTGNKDYPDIGQQVTDLKELNQQFSDALVATQSKDLIKIEQKNVLRNRLIDALEKIVVYVNYKANGDRSMILGAGLSCSSEPKTNVVLDPVDNFKIKLGKDSGEIIYKTRAVGGARFYEFYYALSSEPGNWKNKSDTKCKKTITGLLRGQEYDVRIAAVGAGGVKVYSATITILVV